MIIQKIKIKKYLQLIIELMKREINVNYAQMDMKLIKMDIVLILKDAKKKKMEFVLKVKIIIQLKTDIIVLMKFMDVLKLLLWAVSNVMI